MKSLVLIFLCSVFENGASADVESVSVTVGDSLTLHTNTKIKGDDVIEWSFGTDLIARINSMSNKNIVLVNANSNRVKLNNQTGNLKIRNFRITDCGLYKLDINGASGLFSKTFNVSGVSNAASDGVKSVSVLEKDSVILHTGQTHTDHLISWRFKDTLVAQINLTSGNHFTRDDVLDGRFKGKLKLNSQTGSLIITNIRPNISGLYEVDISASSRNYTTLKMFDVSTIDGGNRLSVMEGTSVTLESGFSTINSDYEMIWRFEHGDSVVATISNRHLNTFDGADGRFRGALELDNKTGSLTIRDVTTDHAGLFHLDMTSNRHAVFKRFSLSVCPQTCSSCVKTVIFSVLLLFLTVALLLICCFVKKHRRESIRGQGPNEKTISFSKCRSESA